MTTYGSVEWGRVSYEAVVVAVVVEHGSVRMGIR
jgi:hypothetical protein